MYEKEMCLASVVLMITQHSFPYVSTFVTIEEFDNCWIQHREFRKGGEEETLVAIYYEISERK